MVGGAVDAEHADRVFHALTDAARRDIVAVVLRGEQSVSDLARLTPGGSVIYLLTGLEGDKHRGWWRVQAVDAPHRLEFEDGFADDAGNPNADLPTTTVRVTLQEQAGGGTRMEIASTFPSLEAMEQLIAMGVEEGMAAAIGQIDQLLAPQGR
jgi:uncharacterized protein YndB with AHSA1/START domain